MDDAAPPQFLDEEALSQPHGRGGASSFKELSYLIGSDLFRYAGNRRLKSFLLHFGFTPGFKYSVWMRLCGYLRRKPLLKATLFPPAKLALMHARYKYGIAIPEYTIIGPGLFINRFGGVMVNGDAIIGSNVNITHGVMIGQANRGKNKGSPTIGDRVFLGAGCKVVGAISIGDDASIGVNAVVTRDVPPSGVAVGIPAKVISMEGSEGYVNRLAPPPRY